jgi:hypothetical protein
MAFMEGLVRTLSFHRYEPAHPLSKVIKLLEDLYSTVI